MKTTIGVFFGGRSVEHEISVISALQAIAALDPARYNPIPVYITKQGNWLTGKVLLDTAAYRDLPRLERKAKPFRYQDIASRLDIAIPVLHGTNGEDGTFQGLLEMTGIPYVGCNVLSSAVGMDKIAMKMMLRESGLPVIDYIWFTDRQWGRNTDGENNERNALISRIEAQIGYPAIVKPANLGSSVGISRALDRAELVRAIDEASGYSSRLLVEKMIDPLREINCSVLGSADDCRTSVCEEPIRNSEILTYTDKYTSGNGSKAQDGTKVSGGMSSTKRRLPADIPADVTTQIQHLATETFRVLGCDGVARIDFILAEKSAHASAPDAASPTVYINEINTIPGSLSFYLWEASGLSFSDLMDTLIARALKRERAKSHKTVSYSANIFNLGGTGKGSKITGKK